MFETWVFYAFGAVLLASGLLVITARNPVHAVLWLVLTFFSVACTWIIGASEAGSSRVAICTSAMPGKFTAL